ncbi:MAG: CidA/LrgA family protein [Candidatus Eremiobacteraeota bacterium]|nr:CidA/LrgA family protein [Candidatus Eremiobacteraeota bacterium]
MGTPAGAVGARPLLRPRWAATLGGALRLVAQMAALWAFSAGGSALASGMDLPVPGNVIGLCALFGGLASGLLRSEWFESGGGFLTKHLAFFFVPVTVGVMAFGSVFARAGTGIVVSLLVSTVLGYAVAGVTTERLSKRS